MGNFARALHHLDMKDVKKKRLEEIAAQKLKEKKDREEKKIIQEISKKYKSDWKREIYEGMTTANATTITVAPAEGDGTVTAVDVIDASSYSGTVDGFLESGDSFDGNTGSVIRDNGSGSGQDGGFNVGGKYLSFQGDGYNEFGSFMRWAVLTPIDSSRINSLTITAIVGNDSNGGEDPDASLEDLRLMYKTPSMEQLRLIVFNPSGSVVGATNSDIIIPLGASGNSGLNNYSIEIPEWTREKNTQFALIQLVSSGTGFDNYGITNIKFQRTTPVNVVVPLDDPEAISFVRVGSDEGDPKKRKKKLNDQLAASDEYTQAQLGDDFPGRGARVGGDDPFASAKIGDDVKPSPIGKAEVKKAFGATQLKTALGQSDVQKADPQANVTNIVKSGKVKTQTTEPQSSLSDFQTRKEKSKEQQVLNAGKEQGPTSNNLINKIDEKDIQSDPTILDQAQNFGADVTNKIEQSLDNALEYLAKPIPESSKNKGQGGRPVGDTTNRYDGVNTSGRYNLNLATELPISIVTGQPREIKISEEGAISMVNSIKSKEQLNNLSNFVTFNNSTPTDAENTINPVGKTDGVLGDGWQIQGGSTFNVVTDKAGNIEALEIVSNKTLRTTSGGESVTRDASGKIVKFTDIPDVPLEVVERKTEQLLQNPIVDKFLGGLANVVKVVTLNQGGEGYEYMGKTFNNAWDMMKANPELGYDEFVTELATVGKNIAETTVQGTASNAVALRDFLQNIEIKSSIDDKGWKPFANNSDIENIGGAKGHVFSKAVIPVENISPEVLETLKEAQKNQASDGTTTAPEIGDGKIGSDDTTEPEFGYEPSNNLNIKANDIIGKSMGDINNVSEADLDFLIKNGYPVDDIFFGGQTQSPVGDLIGLGLSVAAIKLALPLLLKAGGSLVSLVKKEWGMRALTDAAFKTFETTGKMPPWYHWAAHKLLPQPVLNTYAKLMGLKSIPQSILSTGGTKAGNIGLLGLGATAIAKITELMLQGRNKEADKLVVTEMTRITNKNIDNMSEDELYKVFGNLDSSKFNDYGKFIESSKVPSSFRSSLKTLDEYNVEYKTLNDEMNSLDDNPKVRQAFDAYVKNREEISNEMFKFSKYGDGYRNNPDLDPRVLIPDPKGLERTDLTSFSKDYKPYINADKEYQKSYEKYDKHYKDKVEPAYAAAEAYAKNLTYNSKTKQYQGTD